MTEENSSPGWCCFGFCDNVVRLALSGVVAGCLVMASPTWARAQESSVSAAAPASASHRFFDVQNIALIGIESGALFADGVYTQRALKNYPELFREADPIARPFVLRGWPGQIAGGAIFVGADVGLRYLFHQKGHHRLERLLPLVLTVYGTAGAIHGARELRRVERGR